MRRGHALIIAIGLFVSGLIAPTLTAQGVIRRPGSGLFPDGLAGAPSIAFYADKTHGLFNNSSQVYMVANGQILGGWDSTSFFVGANFATRLVEDAVNVLALKNGTNAQTIRVYGTTTGTKYLILNHDGTNPTIDSSSGGLKFGATAVAPAATGTRYLCISTTGVVASSATACSGT